MGPKFLFFALLLSFSSAHARVFSFSDATIGTFFKGSIGMTVLKDQAFKDSSGSATVAFDKTVPFQFGGEFGIVFARPFGGFRISLDLVSPRKLEGVTGSNSSGVSLMTFDSQITGFGPGGHLEFYLSQGKQSKTVLSIGASYLTVNVLNSYRLTADGNAAYPSIVDHTEETTGRGFSPMVSLGLEFSAFDNVTILADVGYRYLILDSFTFVREGTTFTGGMGAGTSAKNSLVQERLLSLSGVFTGIAFRFYF